MEDVEPSMLALLEARAAAAGHSLNTEIVKLLQLALAQQENEPVADPAIPLD